MKNGFRYGFGLAFALFVTGVIGCSDTVDEVTNKIDCHTVCSRYADCFDSDYDVDGCSDRCESRAGSDDDRQRALRSCDDCIGDRSCTSTAFNCADNCAGIVP